MKIEVLESFPPNENPFHHDSYCMGTYIGQNVCIMFTKHRINTEIIVIDTQSGERIKVHLSAEKGED